MDDHVLRRRPGGRDLLVLGGVLLVAAALRLFFFTGVFGSDEVTYTLSAVRLLNGDPGDSTYIGALRYGINIPVALFMAAFGPSVWSASLWALSCGLADVALIYACARILWGATPALLAGLTVAFLPLHVHLSGRLLADTPVAAFITLSIVLFLLAERRRDPRLHLAAGLASAGVLWIKQALVPYWGVFVVYVLLGRRWNWHWLWVIGGMAVGLAANCVAE